MKIQEVLKKQLSTKEKARNIKQIKSSIIKWNTRKYRNYSNESTVSKFVTRKWIELNGLSGGQYSAKKNVSFKTPILRSDLCDYSDAYIVVKGRITVEGTNPVNRRNKKLTFKNVGPFRSCISKIIKTFMDNAEDPDV